MSPLRPVEYRWGKPSPGCRQDQSSFEGWMNVRIENTGDKDLLNVTASISGHPVNVTVVQGNVTVGNIKAGDSVWSLD